MTEAPPADVRYADPRDVPVLLIVFNRADPLRQLLGRLRETGPRRVFVAADGPRAGVDDDGPRCERTRAVLAEIDWDCEVRTLFQSRNLGCKEGPETAIGWFLDATGEGVILEDDILPAPEFLPFCAALLDHHRDHDRVMMISGYNLVGTLDTGAATYLYSRTSPTWGWATWRRAWRRNDPTMAAWDDPAVRRHVRERMGAVEYRINARRIDLVRSERLDAWDFAWTLTMLRLDGISAIPRRSLISNVGFGPDATHTRHPWQVSPRVLPSGPPLLPLRHPASDRPSPALESRIFHCRFPWSRTIMTLMPTAVSRVVRSAVTLAVRRRTVSVAGSEVG